MPARLSKYGRGEPERPRQIGDIVYLQFTSRFKDSDKGAIHSKLGRTVFPERSGIQPQEGEYWKCQITGENPAKTVYIVSLIEKRGRLFCYPNKYHLEEDATPTIKEMLPYRLFNHDLNWLQEHFDITRDIVYIEPVQSYYASNVEQSYFQFDKPTMIAIPDDANFFVRIDGGYLEIVKK